MVRIVPHLIIISFRFIIRSMKGFMNFIREQGVVGLAVGLTLGGAVSKFVTAMVEDLVNPLVGIVIGSKNGLASAAYTIPHTQAIIKWGDLLSKAIDFMVIAFLIYVAVSKIGLSRLDKKK